MQQTQAQLRSLQILRAVAATSVVYFHIECIPRFGSFGVDIFFVISGFVMSLIVANGESPSQFCINRVARIVPLYWLLTTGLLALAWFFPSMLDSTTANLTNYVKSLLFIPYYKENGFLQPLLSMGWSLNYEMYFYAIIWIAIVACRSRFVLLTLAALLGGYVLFGRILDNRVMHSFFGDYMVFEFIAGMLLYQGYRRRLLSAVPKVVFAALAVGAFVFMAYIETQIAEPTLEAFGPPAIVLVYSVVQLEGLIACFPEWLSGRLVELGDASYATYLSHYYIVAAFVKILHQRLGLIDPFTPLGVLLIIAIALIAGHFIYSYVDKPISRWLRGVLRRKLAGR